MRKGLLFVFHLSDDLLRALAVVGLMVKGLGDCGLQSFLLLIAVGGIGMVVAWGLDRAG